LQKLNQQRNRKQRSKNNISPRRHGDAENSQQKRFVLRSIVCLSSCSFVLLCVPSCPLWLTIYYLKLRFYLRSSAFICAHLRRKVFIRVHSRPNGFGFSPCLRVSVVGFTLGLPVSTFSRMPQPADKQSPHTPESPSIQSGSRSPSPSPIPARWPRR
jgi:hypothetical protein